MDWGQVNLEPNLKYSMDLKDDLKKQYYEMHEKAKQTLVNFTCAMQNVYLQYQKMVESNLELSIENKIIKQRLKDCKCSEKVSEVANKLYSEVISDSKNCNLEDTTSNSTNKKIDNKANDDIFYEKENICKFVQIYTEDFNSDIEDGSSEKNKSQLRPIVNNSIKVQNSPILSKSKRHSSKKSNSSLSNNSITSSNDSKISLTPSNLNKNNGKIDYELDTEYEQSNREPVQEVKSNECTLSNQNKSNRVLSVLNIDYGKYEFTERDKKWRQSKLMLKKIVPLIDLSKVNSDENLKKGDSCSKYSNYWNETFFNKEETNKKSNITKEKNCRKNISDFYDKKEFETESDSMSPAVIKNLNETHDDELIETSPAQSESSKLRNKLNMRKPQNNRLKQKHTIGNSQIITSSKNSKLWIDEYQNDKTHENQDDEASQNSTGEKRKSFEGLKTFNDETYFSLLELSGYKKNVMEFDVDATNFEDEVKNCSPPLKKMLMSSFDVIPGRKERSPEYAYKEAPVRKKAERVKLPGWSCKECEKWYDHLPDEEKKKRQNECSRHRRKYKANILTPESFWNPDFDNDETNSLPGTD